MDIQISGNDVIVRRLLRLRDEIRGPGLDAAAVAGAMPIQNHAKLKAPALTGNLRRSIHTELIARGQAMVGTNLVYAKQVEYGGTILPRVARALAFRTRDGRMVFARRVYQRPRPYMRPAFDEKREDAVRATGVAIADVVMKAAKS